MKEYNVYTDDKFLELQKQVFVDLKLTPDNIQEKILKFPVIYTKYRKKYSDQRKILKEIQNDMRKEKKRLYHHYKFDFDYKLSTVGEINTYVDGDDDWCALNLAHDTQEGIVNFLSDTISQITKMSFLIRSYVDLEKMRNGVMS